MSSSVSQSPEKEIVKAFEAAGVVDYLQYLQSTRRIMWTNFVAGIMRGFGVTIGMTLVLAVFIWILTQLVALPVIGEYFAQLETYVQDYVEKTNYTDEFEQMNRSLTEISANTRP